MSSDSPIVPISQLGLPHRASYRVTPPAVSIRSNHYVLSFYLPDQKQPIVRYTHIAAVREDMDPKLRKLLVGRLKDMIQEVVDYRNLVLLGQYQVQQKPPRPKSTSFSQLLEEFNATNRKWRGSDRAEKTLDHRRQAMRFLERKFPHLTVQTLSQDNVYALRDDAVTQDGLSPASVRGYFVDLRAMFRFAVTSGLIKVSPFDDITVEVPDKRPRRVKEADLWKLLYFLWRANQPHPTLTSGKAIFFPLLIERCTLIRAQDVLDIDLDKYDEEERELEFYNSKGKRWEIQPVSNALHQVIMLCRQYYGNRTSSIETVKTLIDYTKRACVYAGVPVMTTHDMKRMGAQALDRLGVSGELKEMVAHHVPHGSAKTFHTNYSRERVQWLRYLELDQTPMLEKLSVLDTLPEDLNRYKFSNPASNKSRDAKVQNMHKAKRRPSN